MSDRPCKQCGSVLVPREGESTNFHSRKFCCGSCRSKWLVAHSARPPQTKAIYARIAEVFAKDPDLEGWQLVERFGLARTEARELRRRLLRRVGMAKAS